jgi:uncharacterized membrane protein
MRKILISILMLVLLLVIVGCSENVSTTGQIVKEAATENDFVKIQLSEISSDLTKFSYDADGVLVKYFVVEDPNGNIKTAFDACDVCGGAKGYAQVGDDVKCIKCGRFFNLEDLGTKNKGGGCWPSHLNHRIEGGYILIDKFELAQGASMFK